MNKTALVLGSTGLVGSLLLEELLKDDIYKNIILIARRSCGIQDAKIQEIVTDFSNYDFMQQVIPVDTIFSCLGTTKKRTPNLAEYRKIEIEIPQTIAQRCLLKGRLNAIHIVSAIGANATSYNFYSKIKGEMEAAISALEIPRTFIYRPALILGNRRNDNRFLEKMGAKLAPIMDSLLSKKMIKYHSIPAQDIARSMLYNDINVFVNGTTILEYPEMQLGI